MNVLVTGANGHLGNNTVRFFLNKNIQVLAGVRKDADVSILKGLQTKISYLDYHSESQLTRAFENVDIVVHTAAVFKRWAKDPTWNIIGENVQISKNVVNAAANARVKKLIYISSIAALDDKKLPMDGTTWNTLENRPYPYSKAQSEKIALQTAKERGLDICTILPATIVGENFNSLTPSLKLFSDIIHHKLPMIPRFNFLFTDVKDVVEGIYSSIAKGKNGSRYVIGNPNVFSVEDIVDLAIRNFPQLKLKKPAKAPKGLMLLGTWFSEKISFVTGKEPMMTVEDFKEWWDASLAIDISKAQQELGFIPRSIESSMVSTFNYLIEKSKK